jgi:hypothetical protein
LDVYLVLYEHIEGEKLMMTEEKIPQISAKLNPEFDSELIEQIKSVPKRERSYMYREALKKYFNEKEGEGK